MAHFAQIDANNVVTNRIVVANDAIDGGTFPESEPIGQAFIAECGLTGTWLQCSYSSSFRGAFPGDNWTYDPDLDRFVAPSIPQETP